MSSFINKCTFDDDYDFDDIQTINQTNIDCKISSEFDDEDALEFIHENDFNICQLPINTTIDVDQHQHHQHHQNNFNNAQKNITLSSPAQSVNVSNRFENSLSPIDPSANRRTIHTFHKNLDKTTTSTRSIKRKAVKLVANKNASSQSTPSQIIPRKKKS